MNTPDNDRRNLKEKTLQLCLHAFDLPRHGLFRGSPNAFVRVHVFADSDATDICSPLEPVECDPERSARESSFRRLLGETEIVPSSSKPRWSKVFYLDLDDDKTSNIFITVHDNVLPKNESNGGASVPDDFRNSLLGAAYFKLKNILDSRDCTQAKRLPKGGWWVSPSCHHTNELMYNRNFC